MSNTKCRALCWRQRGSPQGSPCPARLQRLLPSASITPVQLGGALYRCTVACSYAGQHISNTPGLTTPSSAPLGCGSTAAITLQRQKQVGRACPEWLVLAPSHPRWPHFQADKQLPHIKHGLLSPLQRHASLALLTRLHSFWIAAGSWPAEGPGRTNACPLQQTTQAYPMARRREGGRTGM